MDTKDWQGWMVCEKDRLTKIEKHAEKVQIKIIFHVDEVVKPSPKSL